MSEITQYIIQFLLGDRVSPEICSLVGYTDNFEEYNKYRLVIVPSDFFRDEVYGTKKSLPCLPLQIWEELPILFGKPFFEKIDGVSVLHADIIASTYYLISRYEEMVKSEIRDSHNRFPGKESIAYRAGFIDSPIVDEYGKLLRGILKESGVEVEDAKSGINKIYLTHDVDQLAHFRTIRGALGGMIRGLKRPKEGNKALRSFFGGLRFDPWYTFPYLYKLDFDLLKTIGPQKCEPILFIRSGIGRRKEDKPFPNLLTPDYKSLIKYTKRKGITIGLHASYEAGIKPELVLSEKKRLEHFAKVKIKFNRNHFLNSRGIDDMVSLIDAGITDDFTMGYADIAGFRLGTSKAVKWINPKTKKIMPLTLHPLTIMDVSLSDKRYMYMNAYEAYEYCKKLIEKVEANNGDLILLWHNSSVEKTPSSYHRKLYKDLIRYLISKK